MEHSLPIRIYYEDTDLAGIVYYANYLKFIERGRTEWLRAVGFDQGQIRQDHDIVFAVRKVEADYLRPAVFDDLLTVVTRAIGLTAARIVFEQTVMRGDETLFIAKVTLAGLGGNGRAKPFPHDLAITLQNLTQ